VHFSEKNEFHSPEPFDESEEVKGFVESPEVVREESVPLQLDRLFF